jgi:DNA-directed RNA polymerase specialized sigma24 family protein
MPLKKNLRSSPRSQRGKPDTLLHLVTAGGKPVDGDVRLAVEEAFRRVVCRFRRVDEAILANLAESVAVLVARKRKEILALKQYAFVALCGRVLDRLRRKPQREIAIGQSVELQSVMQATEDPAFAEIEVQYLLEQMKAQLSERDRVILLLLERNRGQPAEVAEALHLTYAAAAKAIQRTKERMAQLLTNPKSQRGRVAFSSEGNQRPSQL